MKFILSNNNNDNDQNLKSKNVQSVSKPVSFPITYKGGHPKLNKEKDCAIEISDTGITISCGFSGIAYISFSDITGVYYETSDQIEKRITATRLLTLGVFALAFKKKKKITEKFFTVDYLENGLENTVFFTGNNAQKAHSEAFNRLSKYKLNNKQDVTVEKDIKQQITPYDELKKLKELLDMDIITQEEFDKKKKELLGL